jgi:hypothetical protein
VTDSLGSLEKAEKMGVRVEILIMGLGGPDVCLCFRISGVLREWSWSSIDLCPCL